MYAGICTVNQFFLGAKIIIVKMINDEYTSEINCVHIFSALYEQSLLGKANK